MDKNTVRKALEDGQYEIELEKRYKNHAWRFKLSDGTSVFCGDAGKVWATGKAKKKVEGFLTKTLPSMKNNKVFIVYGRDLKTRDELMEMIRSWGVDPLAIDSLPTQGRTVIEQLEHYIPQTNFGIVLATPDDVGYLAGHKNEAKFRARQNVVLELGMLLSKLGRSRIAVVFKHCENFDKPSDINGMLYIEYGTSITEVAVRLKREMNSHGYCIA